MKLEELTKEQLIDTVKQLKRRKKFGLVWEDKPEDVVEKCKTELPVLEEVKSKELVSGSELPTNLIIEGDNYHALSVLNYTHAGNIDVIYIDPPYNTGARDWKYNNDYVDGNDTYRHSKWLSMMKNRLKNVKNLLSEKGVLICTIDKYEQATLALLLNELFSDYDIVCVTIIHNPAGTQGKNFSYTNEYAFFVFPKSGRFINKTKRKDALVSAFRDWGTISLRGQAKTCFYPIIVRDMKIVGFGEVCDNDFHPDSSNIIKDNGDIYVYPIGKDGIEKKWVFSRGSVEKISGELFCKKSGEKISIYRTKDEASYKTVWDDKKFYANIYGSKLLNKIIDNDFPFPKSLYAVMESIKAVIHDKNDSIILDYFAGSGTTGHAVLELNKEDSGNRKFILCTNNENGIAQKVCYPRIKNVIKGYSDVKGIPANLKYFKTSFVKKSTVTDDTRVELVRKSVDMICVKENTFENVVDKEGFKVFKDFEHSTGVLFNLEQLSAFKEALGALDIPSSIYVFSLTNDTYDRDFEDLSVEHKLCPIPESILEVYRKLFKE